MSVKNVKIGWHLLQLWLYDMSEDKVGHLWDPVWCRGKLSVCPLSVTLMYIVHDHIVWVTSKIITGIVRLWSLLLAALTLSICSKGTSSNFCWNRSGIWKKWVFGIQKPKAVKWKSLIRDKIEQKLLFTAYVKLCTKVSNIDCGQHLWP